MIKALYEYFWYLCKATFISPFVGRLDDIGEKGMDLISDIVIMYENNMSNRIGFDVKIY